MAKNDFELRYTVKASGRYVTGFCYPLECKPIGFEEHPERFRQVTDTCWAVLGQGPLAEGNSNSELAHLWPRPREEVKHPDAILTSAYHVALKILGVVEPRRVKVKGRTER